MKVYVSVLDDFYDFFEQIALLPMCIMHDKIFPNRISSYYSPAVSDKP